ncbi:MAG: hypothetical protein ACM3ZA_01165 [Bacillota bacterium]
MNWFGWVLLIAAVGGILWWLSSGNRTAVRAGSAKPAGDQPARDTDHADEHRDPNPPHQGGG